MRMVNFDVLSLVDEAKMKTMRNMDMVFCRNVLIYFDNDVKKKVLNSLFQSLKPGGYLVLGPSDSLHGLNNDFQRTPYSAFNFYQRPAASRPAASKSTAPGFAPAVKPPLAVTTPVAPSSTLQPGQNFRVKMLVNRLNNGLRDLSGDVDTSLTKTIDSFGGISQTLETIQKAEDLPSKVRSELNAVNRQIARILVYMQVGDRAQQKSEAMRGLLQELSDRIFGTDKEAQILAYRPPVTIPKSLPTAMRRMPESVIARRCPKTIPTRSLAKKPFSRAVSQSLRQFRLVELFDRLGRLPLRTAAYHRPHRSPRPER